MKKIELFKKDFKLQTPYWLLEKKYGTSTVGLTAKGNIKKHELKKIKRK